MAASKAVSVGTSATELIGANDQRIKLTIQNLDSGEIYYGEDNTVTAANGIKLAAAASVEEEFDGHKWYQGAVWAIVSSGTADVRVWERTFE